MDGPSQTAGLQTLSSQMDLNAHDPAPAELREFFKALKGKDGENHPDVIDLDGIAVRGLESIPTERLHNTFQTFKYLEDGFRWDTWSTRKMEAADGFMNSRSSTPENPQDIEASAFGFKHFPGLILLRALLPDHIQRSLLSRLVHRDLSNRQHQTNLHLHYDISYPEDGRSLFNLHANDVIFEPKDPSIHKNLTIKQVLEKKLRWMTLGGQYDWTNKVYPTEPPPEFPVDIAALVHGLFPDMEPQAAIVNFYSPGDTLNMHRDVSEEVNRPLVSISLGCACIFVIGLEDQSSNTVQKLALHLKSGDVLYMSGESRLAWHGVPKIIPRSCPQHLLKYLPACTYPHQFDWISNKRVNLNVRQMRESATDDPATSDLSINYKMALELGDYDGASKA